MAETRDPTTPGWGATRSAIAGAIVLAATTFVRQHSTEAAGEAAGVLIRDLLFPAVGGIVLGIGTYLRKWKADWDHASGQS